MDSIYRLQTHFIIVDIDQFLKVARIDLREILLAKPIIAQIYNMWWIKELIFIGDFELDERVKFFRNLQYFDCMTKNIANKDIIKIIFKIMPIFSYGPFDKPYPIDDELKRNFV